MSNSWETLAADCDQSATKCGWCHTYGHSMPECPKYTEWYAQGQAQHNPVRREDAPVQQPSPKPAPMWPGLLLLAAIMVVAYLFWTELAR